jgi:hypothetical protein
MLLAIETTRRRFASPSGSWPGRRPCGPAGCASITGRRRAAVAVGGGSGQRLGQAQPVAVAIEDLVARAQLAKAREDLLLATLGLGLQARAPAGPRTPGTPPERVTLVARGPRWWRSPATPGAPGPTRSASVVSGSVRSTTASPGISRPTWVPGSGTPPADVGAEHRQDDFLAPRLDALGQLDLARRVSKGTAPIWRRYTRTESSMPLTEVSSITACHLGGVRWQVMRQMSRARKMPNCNGVEFLRLGSCDGVPTLSVTV